LLVLNAYSAFNILGERCFIKALIGITFDRF
jgi:hypothetical protein